MNVTVLFLCLFICLFVLSCIIFIYILSCFNMKHCDFSATLEGFGFPTACLGCLVFLIDGNTTLTHKPAHDFTVNLESSWNWTTTKKNTLCVAERLNLCLWLSARYAADMLHLIPLLFLSASFCLTTGNKRALRIVEFFLDSWCDYFINDSSQLNPTSDCFFCFISFMSSVSGNDFTLDISPCPFTYYGTEYSSMFVSNIFWANVELVCDSLEF